MEFLLRWRDEVEKTDKKVNILLIIDALTFDVMSVTQLLLKRLPKNTLGSKLTNAYRLWIFTPKKLKNKLKLRSDFLLKWKFLSHWFTNFGWPIFFQIRLSFP